MPIEVTTRYTYTTYRNFFNFSLYRRTFQRRCGWLIVACLIWLGLILLVQSWWMRAAILLLIGLLTILLPRPFYKRYIAHRRLIEHCRITEERIEVTGEADGVQTKDTYRWSDLCYAYETVTLFVLYITPKQIILLDQYALTADEATRLAGLAAAKLGDKFHKT